MRSAVLQPALHAHTADQQCSPLTCNLLCCWLLASVCCCQCALVCVRLKAHRLDSFVVQVQAERNARVERTLQRCETAAQHRLSPLHCVSKLHLTHAPNGSQHASYNTLKLYTRQRNAMLALAKQVPQGCKLTADYQMAGCVHQITLKCPMHVQRQRPTKPLPAACAILHKNRIKIAVCMRPRCCKAHTCGSFVL